MRFRAFAAALILAPVPFYVAADGVQPWGSRDFSAKRVGVPQAGHATRLVQIDPDEEPYHLTPARPRGVDVPRASDRGNPDAKPGDPAAWFWAGVSPALSAGSPDRLAQALGRLALADRARAPSWKALSAMIEAHGAALAGRTQGTRVSPALALAVMAVESSGRADVTSSAGAQGLMQLMPDTAARFGVADPFNADENIRGGVAYLEFLLRAFGDDPILALAAYNAGEGAVARHGGVPPFSETRAYVPKVLSTWSVARMFCRVPPDRVTDPCAFMALTSAEAG